MTLFEVHTTCCSPWLTLIDNIWGVCLDNITKQNNLQSFPPFLRLLSEQFDPIKQNFTELDPLHPLYLSNI